MDRERAVNLAVGGLLVVAVGVAALQSGLVPTPWADQHDSATVRIVDDCEETLATVDVRVADTARERYRGLSGTENLPEGEGMLFVHEEEAPRTYVMREMNYGLDIVFVGADERITAIRHARAPRPGEDGESLRHSGRAKWVLEVPRGYTNETGVEAGDQVRIDYGNETG
jgi:uncharacterized membrane protein (UPF0127 family)